MEVSKNRFKLPYRIEPKERLEAVYTDSVSNHLDKDFYVAFFDGNSIKEVNDNFGHLAGDKVIYEIANTILSAIRPSDQIVRFGGDEFVVFLNNFDSKHIRAFITRIQNKIGENTSIAALIKRSISVSVGVARLRDKAKAKESLQELLQEADALMYAAKSSPPNFLKISGEVVDIEKRNHVQVYDSRLRSLFNWVLSTMMKENPDLNKEKLATAGRVIWSIHGTKLLYKTSINEIMSLIKVVYKQNESGEVFVPEEPIKIDPKEHGEFIEDFRNFLTNLKNKISHKKAA